MTLTITLPDDAAARARAVAEARGLDLPAFVAAAAVEATEAEEEGPDMEIVAAALESLEDARAGRLLSLEEVAANMEASLAAARQRRKEAGLLPA